MANANLPVSPALTPSLLSDVLASILWFAAGALAQLRGRILPVLDVQCTEVA